jgi:hypothetical protein
VDILKVSLLTSDKYFLDPTKGKSEKGLFWPPNLALWKGSQIPQS